MSPEEIKSLGEKVAKETATPEEKLAFFRELNGLISGMREDIKQIKLEKIKRSINESK